MGATVEETRKQPPCSNSSVFDLAVCSLPYIRSLHLKFIHGMVSFFHSNVAIIQLEELDVVIYRFEKTWTWSPQHAGWCTYGGDR